MPYFSHDDIAQIGTPPGRGLVGALRLSGDNAFAILLRVAPGLDADAIRRGGRRAHDCRLRLVLSGRGKAHRVKEVRYCPARVYCMPAPASYTREDVAEIHLPGAPAVLKAALAALVAEGARPAAAGEFTFRAFRNGRISLGQAEAVEAVVKAENDDERRRALARIGDQSGEKVRAWLDRAMAIAARMEAALDFSEEEPDDDIAPDLANMAAQLAAEGVELTGSPLPAAPGLPRVALVGLANAGKSSLFNALLGRDDALVSPEASTTRDCLKRDVVWGGVRLELSDNPGFHPDGAGGAREAADRSFSRLGGEDVACWVLDGSRPLGVREREFAQKLPPTVAVVVNKADLPRVVSAADASRLVASTGRAVAWAAEASAATGAGVDNLERLLAGLARAARVAVAWNSRESWELAAALDGCRAAAAELAGPGRLELAADDMRRAASAFSRILGVGYAEDALVRIFSGFCIGK